MGGSGGSERAGGGRVWGRQTGEGEGGMRKILYIKLLINYFISDLYLYIKYIKFKLLISLVLIMPSN